MQTLSLCQVDMSWHVEDYKTIGWPAISGMTLIPSVVIEQQYSVC